MIAKLLMHKVLLAGTILILAAILPNASRGQQSGLETSGNTKTISTNLTGFTVPFKIDNESGLYVEVHLYTSTDHGKSWKFYSRQDVSHNGFKFTSNGDGEYWFALKTLDRNRQLIPSGNITKPELRIIVDTKKPVLEFALESDAAGRVTTSWKINDEFLDTTSLKLTHRDIQGDSDQKPWIPITFNSKQPIVRNTYSDRVAWWPQTLSKRIEVRIEIADAAGNTTSSTRTISMRNVAINRSGSNSTTTRENPFVSLDVPYNSQRQSGRLGRNVVCKNGVCKIADHNSSIPKQQSRSSPNPPNPNTSQIPTRQVGSRGELFAPPSPLPGGIPSSNRQFAQSKLKNNQDSQSDSIVWESKTSKWTEQNRTQQASTLKSNQFSTQDSPKPELKMKNRFQDIPVVRRDPSKMEQVPWTPNQVVKNSTSEDDGELAISQSAAYGRGKPINTATPGVIQGIQSNQQPPSSFGNSFAGKPNNNKFVSNAARKFIAPTENKTAQQLNINSRRFNLNYDIRAIDPSGVGRVILWATENDGATWKSWATDPDNASPFPVEVSKEGLYGFRVVINSNDGLTGKTPVSGNAPDVWVQVDLTAPKVAITSAPYGSGHDIGKLIIYWEANDQFLQTRPIRLSYTTHPNGPWTTIQDKLRNTGSYAWKVPPQVPEQIFLRIEANDTAKNTGVFQLPTPIDISGLVPRGRIYGVEAIR